MAAIKSIVTDFLAAPCVGDGRKQIISLGAGFDTLPFRLMHEGIAPYSYVELDFPAVLQRKIGLIAQRPELQVYIVVFLPR